MAEKIDPRREPIAVGVDVGSTTVKAVVVDPVSKKILWSDYQRHQTKQAEFVLSFFQRIKEAFPNVADADARIFITGSGGAPIAPHVGAKFVQEVNAVTLAVETLHPDVGSVCELGGQDAKIIIFKKNEETGNKTAITSMNDKCASGTGATIDKCVMKVGLPNEEVVKIGYDDSKLHHVAAKCGVFAETDIVNFVKSGIPSIEIMNSLADAIVMQNLSVLTRGNTLRHKVLLLGGPEHVSAVPARLLAQAHPRGLERSRLRVSERRADRRADHRPRERAVLRGVRRRRLRPVRSGHRRRLSRASTAWRTSSRTAAPRASARRPVRRSSSR